MGGRGVLFAAQHFVDANQNKTLKTIPPKFSLPHSPVASQRVTSSKAVLPRVAGRSARLNVQANKKVAKKATVVLMEADPNLGAVGDVVEVSLGFFRNNLEPMGKAKKVGRGFCIR